MRWKHVNRPLRKGFYDRFGGALPKRANAKLWVPVLRTFLIGTCSRLNAGVAELPLVGKA